MGWGWKGAWMAGAVCLGLAASSCGTSPSRRTEVSVMGRAASATALATSARITEIFASSSGGGKSRSTLTGVYAFNRRTGSFTERDSGTGAQASTQLIATDRAVYTSIPDGGGFGPGLPPGKRWISAPRPTASPTDGSLMASLLQPWGASDPALLLDDLSRLATSVTTTGHATLDGNPVTEYSVSFKATRATKCAAAQFGSSSPLTLWVDDEGRVRQLHLELSFPGVRVPETAATMPSVRVSVTVTDTDFGVPVSVAVPPPAQVETLQQLQQAITQQSHGSSGIVSHVSIANKASCSKGGDKSNRRLASLPSGRARRRPELRSAGPRPGRTGAPRREPPGSPANRGPQWDGWRAYAPISITDRSGEQLARLTTLGLSAAGRSDSSLRAGLTV